MCYVCYVWVCVMCESMNVSCVLICKWVCVNVCFPLKDALADLSLKRSDSEEELKPFSFPAVSFFSVPASFLLSLVLSGFYGSTFLLSVCAVYFAF